MSLLFRLAIRNISRHPQRSIVVIAAISMSVCAVSFLWGFFAATTGDMRDNTIDILTGHLQVEPKGFSRAKASWLAIKDYESLLGALEADPSVEAASGRIESVGLLGTDDRSRSVEILGVDFERERHVTRFGEKLVKGSYLTGEPGEVLLGRRLADRLDLSVGDEVVVVGRDQYGMSTGAVGHVKGIFRVGDVVTDRFLVLMNLPAVQDLTGLDDQVSRLVIRLKEDGHRRAVQSRFEREAAFGNLKFVAWTELAPQVEQWVGWGMAVSSFIMMVIVFVIAFSVMNTLLMSVMERTREFGVLLAVGMKPMRIVSMVLLESLAWLTIGNALGLGLGYLVVCYFGTSGIHLRFAAGALETNFMSSVIYPIADWPHVFVSAALFTVVTLIAALYPAAYASRLKPVTAIYQV